jgi:hypothetical protein
MIAYKLLSRHEGQLVSLAFYLLPPTLIQTYIPGEVHRPQLGKFLAFGTLEHALAVYNTRTSGGWRAVELWACEVTEAEPLEFLPVPNPCLVRPRQGLARFWKTRKSITCAPKGTIGVGSIQLTRRLR